MAIGMGAATVPAEAQNRNPNDNVVSFGGAVNVKPLGSTQESPEDESARVNFEVSLMGVYSSNHEETAGVFAIRIPADARDVRFELIGTRPVEGKPDPENQYNTLPPEPVAVSSVQMEIVDVPDLAAADAFRARVEKIKNEIIFRGTSEQADIVRTWTGGVPNIEQLEVFQQFGMPVIPMAVARLNPGDSDSTNLPNVQYYQISSNLLGAVGLNVSWEVDVTKETTYLPLRANGAWKCNGVGTSPVSGFEEGCQSLEDFVGRGSHPGPWVDFFQQQEAFETNSGATVDGSTFITESNNTPAGTFGTPNCVVTGETGRWSVIGTDVTNSSWSYIQEFRLHDNHDILYHAPLNEDFCDQAAVEVSGVVPPAPEDECIICQSQPGHQIDIVTNEDGSYDIVVIDPSTNEEVDRVTITNGENGLDGNKITVQTDDKGNHVIVVTDPNTGDVVSTVVVEDGKDGTNGTDDKDGHQIRILENEDGTPTLVVFGPATGDIIDRVIIKPGEKGEKGDTGAAGQDGKDGVDGKDGDQIRIEQNLDGTYTIVVWDPNTQTEVNRIVIRDGLDGTDGNNVSITTDEDGNQILVVTDVNTNTVVGSVVIKKAVDGVDGQDGKDGHKIRILENIDGTSTLEVFDAEDGTIIDRVIIRSGEKGDQGEAGKDGHELRVERNEDGTYTVIVWDPNTETELDRIVLRDGKDGKDGTDGKDVRDGSMSSDGLLSSGGLPAGLFSQDDSTNGDASLSSGSVDGKCIATEAGLGLPLLALIPLGLATQINIPGLSPIAHQLNAMIQESNSRIQSQLGIQNDELSEMAAQSNALLGGASKELAGVAQGAAILGIAALGIGLLVNNCTPGGISSSEA